MSRMELSGRTALITGGASGIGAAFSAMAAHRGARVAILDRDGPRVEQVVAAIEAACGEAVGYMGDVTDASRVSSVVDLVANRYGEINVVFGNAGVPCPAGIEEVRTADWDRAFEVNVRALYLLVKYVLPRMGDTGDRSIVFTASAAALVAMGSQPAYSASKGAVVALTRALASELAPRGIRVNCVCPGWVHTPMMDQYYEQTFPDRKQRNEAFAAAAAAQPLGRFASPDEIAGAVAFLASTDASYVSGIALPVDGAFTSSR